MTMSTQSLPSQYDTLHSQADTVKINLQQRWHNVLTFW